MNRTLSVVLLLAGLALVAFGLNAYHSAASDVSRFFTGAPSNKALWFLIGGGAVGMAGLAGLLQKKKSIGS
jgi:hypothetical protein